MEVEQEKHLQSLISHLQGRMLVARNTTREVICYTIFCEPWLTLFSH